MDLLSTVREFFVGNTKTPLRFVLHLFGEFSAGVLLICSLPVTVPLGILLWVVATVAEAYDEWDGRV